MRGLKWTSFGFPDSPLARIRVARIRAPPADGHGSDWGRLWSACTTNYLRPTAGGTLRALSNAGGITGLTCGGRLYPTEDEGRARHEGSSRCLVIPLLATVAPLGDCLS
jgi:hypothetical protein